MLRIFSQSVHIQLGEWVIRLSTRQRIIFNRSRPNPVFKVSTGPTGWLALFSGAKIHRFGRHGEVLEGEAKVIDHLAFITQQSAPLPANDGIPF